MKIAIHCLALENGQCPVIPQGEGVVCGSQLMTVQFFRDNCIKCDVMVTCPNCGKTVPYEGRHLQSGVLHIEYKCELSEGNVIQGEPEKLEEIIDKANSQIEFLRMVVQNHRNAMRTVMSELKTHEGRYSYDILTSELDEGAMQHPQVENWMKEHPDEAVDVLPSDLKEIIKKRPLGDKDVNPRN